MRNKKIIFILILLMAVPFVTFAQIPFEEIKSAIDKILNFFSGSGGFGKSLSGIWNDIVTNIEGGTGLNLREAVRFGGDLLIKVFQFLADIVKWLIDKV